MSKYEKMSNEELLVLSTQKYKNGCYTKIAISAQLELYNRNHYDVYDRGWTFDDLDLDNERTVEDVDYNG